MTKYILSVRNLVKKYGSNTIIDDLSVDVFKQHSLLVQGTSGCGKTTLFRCMCILETIQGGEITFDGKVVLAPNHKPKLRVADRKRISMVFQNLYLWQHLSVLENVSLPLKTAGMEQAEAEQSAIDMLKKLNISQGVYKLPSALSGGQKQRLALARALVHRPDILLLDEITANLDMASAKLVFEAVEKVIAEGVAIILVSHADKVPVFLQDSKLVFDGGKWVWQQQQLS